MKKILIVDEDPAIRGLYRDIFLEPGYAVETAVRLAFQEYHSCKAFLPKMADPDSVARVVGDMLEGA